MKFFRRLNVRLFLSYLLVVLVGGLTVFLTTRLLAPTIFIDELEGLRLRQGQIESPGPGRGDGQGGTGSTMRPGGSEGDGNGGGTGSTMGPGGSGGDGNSGGPGSTMGPGNTGDGGGAGSGGDNETGKEGGSQDGLNAAGVVLQSDGLTEDEEIEQAFLDSLDRALLIGLLVSVVIAILLAAVVSERVLRPVALLRSAARRLAGGHYEERVPLPSDAELSELAEDFNSLAGALQETEVRRMQLISEVAHELRTPLTTIQGYMEGLIDGVLEPGDEVFASVAEEAARLQRVAADLSVLSRIEEGAVSFEFQMVDLSMVARKVADRLRPQFQDQKVTLEVRTDLSLTVSGDPDRLAQVFTNLVGNALAHTPAGGRVVVASEKPGDVARVTITDTGHGIGAEDLERVFERFYRAEKDPHTTGTGIGLTIARSIVRSHGGELVAFSEGLGKGAKFVLSLPLVE